MILPKMRYVSLINICLAPSTDLHAAHCPWTKSIRALIIGASGKAFCSGHDLQEIQTNTHELFTKCSQTMIRINRLPQPVITMVQGVATAAGCQLVASCDLAVASEVSLFYSSAICCHMVHVQ